MAFARAIATRADVLLLDEPTANLDPRNVRLVEAMIRELQGRGTTLVLVTHQTFQARRLAPRTLVLLDGQTSRWAPPPRSSTRRPTRAPGSSSAVSSSTENRQPLRE